MNFDWLNEQIERVKTPDFFLIDGPLSEKDRNLVETSPLNVPPAYKAFVMRYGNAKLYESRGVYLMEIFSVPKDFESTKGEHFLQFGKTDTGPAYFKESLLAKNQETPVFEWSPEEGFYHSYNGFEMWLRENCRIARSGFGDHRWQEIEQGPPPFNLQETKVIEARKRFEWKVVGIADDGDILFDVHNRSDITLPFLTLGVRGKAGKVKGRIWLPVSAARPGESIIVKKGCYKGHLEPADVEVFDIGDPLPQDRDRFWEFKR